MTNEEAELRAKYRMLFLLSSMGQEVLGDILEMCHMGEPLSIDDPAMIAAHNLGVAILTKLGTYSEGTLPDVIKALAGVVPTEIPDNDMTTENFRID